MPAPDKYPLPWCDKADLPYWQINLIFCATVEGWRKMQSGKPMAEIIPLINARLAVDGENARRRKE